MRLIFPIVLFCAASKVFASDDQLYLLVHPPDASMAVEESYAIELMQGQRRSFVGGLPARVILPSRQAGAFDAIAQGFFSTSGEGMQKLWFKLVFSGRVNAPKYLDSDEEILRYVESNPGSLGIVILEEAPAGVTSFKVDVP